MTSDSRPYRTCDRSFSACATAHAPRMRPASTAPPKSKRKPRCTDRSTAPTTHKQAELRPLPCCLHGSRHRQTPHSKRAAGSEEQTPSPGLCPAACTALVQLVASASNCTPRANGLRGADAEPPPTYTSSHFRKCHAVRICVHRVPAHIPVREAAGAARASVAAPMPRGGLASRALRLPHARANPHRHTWSTPKSRRTWGHALDSNAIREDPRNPCGKNSHSPPMNGAEEVRCSGNSAPDGDTFGFLLPGRILAGTPTAM